MFLISARIYLPVGLRSVHIFRTAVSMFNYRVDEGAILGYNLSNPIEFVTRLRMLHHTPDR